ncbi:hypothetical protein AN958_08963 [Leucoagaricus sp. SymC.cos]|nr:hypothetical protein AN958_08963 [Leucoagaricus sp. SymC.cos]
MLSSLPTELLELVFGFLRDDSDISSLRACSLVSSTFLPIARGFLFGHIFLLPEPRHPAARSYSLAPRTPTTSSHITGPRSGSLSPYIPSSLRTSPEAYRHTNAPEPTNSNACVKLFDLLSTSPWLSQYIKRISIIDGRLFPSPDVISSFQVDRDTSWFSPLGLDNVQSLLYFEIRDKLNGAPWFQSTPPRILYSLFQKLTICAFDLVFQDGPKVVWNGIPRDVRGALNYLFTSPSLRHLQLRRVSWDTPLSLRGFTTTLSQGSVTHLTLRNVKLLSTTTPKHLLHSQHRSQQHHDRRARGRSPTPRSDSPPVHNPLPYRQELLPHSGSESKSTIVIVTSTTLSGDSSSSSHEASSPPYSWRRTHTSSHHEPPEIGARGLRLESLSINGSVSNLGLGPGSGTGSSQDPETLGLLRVLFLPSSGTFPSHQQHSDSLSNPGLDSHKNGTGCGGGCALSGKRNYTGSRDDNSAVNAWVLSVLSIGSGRNDDAVEDSTPMIGSVKRLSVPDIPLEEIPELVKLLVKNGMGSGLEELVLGDRLCFDSNLGISVPSKTKGGVQEDQLVLDFSNFTNLRSLHLGAQIQSSPHSSVFIPNHIPTPLLHHVGYLQPLAQAQTRVSAPFQSSESSQTLTSTPVSCSNEA